MKKRFTININKTKKTGLCFLLLLNLHFTKAQNLIADSSFEHNSGIPTILSSIGMSGTWSQPTRGTTDLFCECNNKKLKEPSECAVPDNPMGIQKANSGKCYAGIYAFSHGDYREYLLTQFIAPLQRGLKYEFSMYLSLSDYSRASIDQFGVCFLQSKPTYTTYDVITGIKPNYMKISEEVGTDTVNWHQLTLEYKAKGGEQFLLLGSFAVNNLQPTNVKAPKGVRTRINQRTERDAYYYIDDVCLHEVTAPYVAKFDSVEVAKADTIKAPVTVTANTTPEKPGDVVLDKPIVLQNVLFETNAAVLLPSSYSELDLTIAHLFSNPAVKIEVNGHTDNIGNEKQNVKLSEKRAKAVAEYFISNSIDATRITFKGYGSQKPIASNENDTGRKQNRRVELVFRK